MLRNPHFSSLSTNYLFSEIQKKLRHFRDNHPDEHIIDLSIGDTSQPLEASIVHAFSNSVERFGNSSTYRGYGPDYGLSSLREEIATYLYKNTISKEEIFISNGAKHDLFRLLSLFGAGKTIAIQDPSYPAYIDLARLTGAKRILPLPCLKETDFTPQIPEQEKIDIFCICSPNNPTGTVLSHKQLQALVDYAIHRGSIILFDAAYSAFITDPDLPKSIFEIPGSRSCAIEIQSLSKPLGFSGIRLGWTVVPEELQYEDGSSIIQDWRRFLSTTFNGVSIPVQEAAVEGIHLFPTPPAIHYYRENSHLLREALQQADFCVYGGEHAPYLWVEVPECGEQPVFDFFLQNYRIAVTPGEGFGSCGVGFARFSSLGKRNDVLLAVEALTKSLLTTV